MMITIRLWYLSVIQHGEKCEEAQRPQQRCVVQRAERATICDRFGIPLATNRIQYQAAICYQPIRQLPRFTWQRSESGKKEKFFVRKDYIARLSHLLAEELCLDPERVEDLIYSRAALLGNAPYILKEDISEQSYFRLKMLEKDWPGIHTEIGARRVYPRGAAGGEVVGYIGPISRREYDAIINEMHDLQEAVENQEEGAQERLVELERMAYTLNDYTGKVGVEATFDEQLRGKHGKRVYLSDTKGNFLREIEGAEEQVPGKQVQISLSIELQEYAEELLALYNQAPPSQSPSSQKRRALIPEDQPWIKAGAIVVFDPNSGEVLTLASFPRYDPNDFIQLHDVDDETSRLQRVRRWLESEAYLGSIWDRKMPLQRERFDMARGQFYEQVHELDWNSFLRMTLPEKSPVKHTIEKRGRLCDALKVQNTIDQLLFLFTTQEYSLTPAKIIDHLYGADEHVPLGVMVTLQERAFMQERSLAFHEQIVELKAKLEPFFHSLPLNYEKLLLVDLYRLVVDASDFDPFFEELFGQQSISEYREISARLALIQDVVKDLTRELFHTYDFASWREAHFKSYLAEKRKLEKVEKRKYARPYLDYLDEVEQEMFSEFWQTHKWSLIAQFLTGDQQDESIYAQSLKTWWQELDAGANGGVKWHQAYTVLKNQVALLDCSILIPYLQTLRSFNDLDRPLYGCYSGLRGHLEKHLAQGFYPTYGYGYARSYAFRQATTVGSIFKIVPAYEALRQRYTALEEQGKSIRDLNPLIITDDKHRTYGKNGGWNVGFSSDGRVIPLYYHGGRLPRSEHSGVGRIDLVRAIETSSNPYFALLAGDVLEDSEDLCKAAMLFGYGEKSGIDLSGEYQGKIPEDVSYNRTGLYSMAIGQHTFLGTPLQTAVMLGAFANGGSVLKPEICYQNPVEERWKIFMPSQIQKPIIDGMHSVVMGEKGTARFARAQFPNSLVERTIGKTSTAEIVTRFGLDATSKSLKNKEIWFGCVVYTARDLKEPDLVIVVYLKHGDFGRHAVPLALKMAEKWQAIR